MAVLDLKKFQQFKHYKHTVYLIKDQSGCEKFKTVKSKSEGYQDDPDWLRLIGRSFSPSDQPKTSPS